MKSLFKLIISLVCAAAIVVTPIPSEAGKRAFKYKKFKTHAYSLNNDYTNAHSQPNDEVKKDATEPRPKFRKATVDKAIAEAPKDIDGNIRCPTCNRKVSNKKVNGRRDFDIDHKKPAWSKRKGGLKTRGATRKEVIEEYQRNVRLQCPSCNRSRKYENQ